jgi:hypothetical protein
MRQIRLLAGALVLFAVPQCGPASAQSATQSATIRAAGMPSRAAPALPPAMQCRKAIAGAEQVIKTPSHLLAAIARVESGRWDAQSGSWQPWPWTINAEGEDSFFETKAQAIIAVRALQARGVISIDVGCMQVNLMYHPNAFASLDQAFDPPANALYAAQFLSQLFTQTNDWAQAAAFYHSATPDLGADYRRRVLAVWPEENRIQESLMQAERDRNNLAAAWAAANSPNRQRPAQVSMSLPWRQGKAATVRPVDMANGATGKKPGETSPGTIPGLRLATYRGDPVRVGP